MERHTTLCVYIKLASKYIR